MCSFGCGCRGCCCSSPCLSPYGCNGYGCPGVGSTNGGSCVCPCPIQPAKGCSSVCACCGFWGHCNMSGSPCNPCCDAVPVRLRAGGSVLKFKQSPSRDFCCCPGVPACDNCS